MLKAFFYSPFLFLCLSQELRREGKGGERKIKNLFGYYLYSLVKSPSFFFFFFFSFFFFLFPFSFCFVFLLVCILLGDGGVLDPGRKRVRRGYKSNKNKKISKIIQEERRKRGKREKKRTSAQKNHFSEKQR